MKRIIAVLLCIALTASAAACSTTPTNSKPVSTASAFSSSAAVSSVPESSSTSSAKGIEVDNGLLSDSITFPASLMKGQDIKTIKANAAKDGITDVVQNKDGSVTYKMTKAAHQKMIDSTKQTTTEAFGKLKGSKDFPYVKDITYNDDFSNITLVIDKTKYEDSYKDILAMDVGLQAYFYQLIIGTKEDNMKIDINFQDTKTKEVFYTQVYPQKG